LCAQLTRDLFAIAKFLLTIGRLLLHCWYSLGRPVTIGTPMVIFAVLTVFWLFLVLCWYTVGTVLLDMWRLVHQWSFLCCFDCFWRLVHCWYSLGRPVTIGTAMVIFAVLTVFWLFLTNGTLYQSSKTVKRQSKQTWPYYNSSSFCTVCTVMSSKLYNISSDEELPVVCLQCFSVFYVSIRSPLCFLLDSEYSPKYSSLCS